MEVVSRILIHVINLSLSASYVVVAVLMIRLLLRKAPKSYSYLLWFVVFIRFACPLTIKSVLSLVPIKQKAISYSGDIVSGNTVQQIYVDTGIHKVDSMANYAFHSNVATKVATDDGLAKMLFLVFTIIWLVGIALLVGYAVIVSITLSKKLHTATLLSKKSGKNGAVYETDQIKSPFLNGIINPKIYIPVGMEEQDINYVLAHEQMHIKRKDYLIKPICFIVVILHWFNPLAWVSFFMMVKDTELSCDEAVIRGSSEDIRTQYSTALLNVSMKQSGLLLPIAFGESNTKVRIKNILNLKKPVTWMGLVGVVILIAAAVTLLTTSKDTVDNRGKNTNYSNQVKNSKAITNGTADGNVSKITKGSADDNANKITNSDANGTTENTMESSNLSIDEMLAALVKNRNPYIGNNSKDLAILGVLPGPEGIEYDHIELQTTQEPYELTIIFNMKDDRYLTSTSSYTRLSDAILLFATIENLGICHFVINSGTNSFMDSYNRSVMEKTYGKLYPKSADMDSMRKLFDDIQSMKLDGEISKAILDFNKNDYKPGEFCTESHVVFDTEKKENEITVYAMVLYQEYGYEDGEFKDVAGNHMSVAITFTVNDVGDYKLKEYWIPKDGSYYAPSIRKKFPHRIEKNAMDTQKYIKLQQAECDKRAKEYLKYKQKPVK